MKLTREQLLAAIRAGKNNQVAFLDFSWPSYPPVQLAVHFSGSRIDVLLRVNRTREFPLFSLGSADAFAVWLDGFYAALREQGGAAVIRYTPLSPPMIQENGRWEAFLAAHPGAEEDLYSFVAGFIPVKSKSYGYLCDVVLYICRLYVENGLRSINMTGVFHAVAAMHGCTKGCLSSGITGELRCAAEGKNPFVCAFAFNGWLKRIYPVVGTLVMRMLGGAPSFTLCNDRQLLFICREGRMIDPIEYRSLLKHP